MLPADVRRRHGITQETPLQIIEEQGQLVIRPMRLVATTTPARADLDELLLGVKPENIHEEIDFGRGVGEEVW